MHSERNGVHGERVLGLELLVAVGLVLGEELGLKDDVSGLVDTVNVSEGGSDREGGGDGEEGVVDVEDVLGLGVKRGVVDACTCCESVRSCRKRELSYTTHQCCRHHPPHHR